MTGKTSKKSCFDFIKRVIGREVLLAYLDFNGLFEIHNHASKIKIGAVISQKSKPIDFYTRKMNSAQQNYTTTKKNSFPSWHLSSISVIFY